MHIRDLMAVRKRKHENKSKALERSVIVVLLLAIAAAVYFNYLAERVQATSGKLGDFDVLRGAKWIDHGSNDGDSFHIRHGGKEYVFRLYYVDCAEKSARRFRDRLAHQGEYFGGLSEAEVVELGLEAKDYVEHLLKRNDFTVYTRWEEVYDSGRFYAMLQIDNRFLSELLVEQGLARIYTKGVAMPDGETFRKRREYLQELESKAESSKMGGWR